MKLNFIGACHEVTGSCHFLEACGKHMLVDYGMEQGQQRYENAPLPVPYSDIDYIFLTHAHIDHSGLLPLAYAKGFRGTIFSTEPTAKLSSIMLRDSAHIQMSEAEWRNRKAKRGADFEHYEPLYTMEDADGAIKLFKSVRYGEKVTIDKGIEVRFTDVGHLLGSAAVELFLTEGEVTKKIVFSGDVGNLNQPIIKDPELVKEADYVLIESTYGERLHSDRKIDYIGDLTKVLQKTLDRGGNVVIPSFAVGRTQELLYFLREIKEKGLVHGHDDFPVYVDSPLAVEATSIFVRTSRECYDDDALALIHRGINPISCPDLNLSITPEDSKAINFDDEPKVIISASGMCDAGRIRHHLKHNLWRPECTILFVGYQSVGTLGRAIVEGASAVKLFGEDISIRAEVETLIGLSGHADKNGLLSWMKGFEKKPSQVFVVHGDDMVTEHFAETLQSELGLKAYAPFSGTKYNLLTGEFEYIAEGVPVAKKSRAVGKAAMIFEKLLKAGERLLSIIRHYEHGANKDIAKMTREINSLADKWDK
ncbi:MAG: MBL fold metallo-hydrolase [Lachnospiraceae bacterium]|nr:MBL fold metallo-hydrolase [Lachnospiraceae bacterium]